MNLHAFFASALFLTITAWADPQHTAIMPSNSFDCASCPTPETKIDKIIGKALAKLDVKPRYCTDSVFIRRAYLDVIGTLPTAQDVRTFLDDKNPDKRIALIDSLLSRPEYADYWAMKWSDILRIKAEFPVNLWPNAAQAYHHWVKVSLRDNKPYDQFVREMLTANGSNFRVGPVNFYRAIQSKTPGGIAAAVALTFMGTRVESWSDKDLLPGMAAFFAQISYKPTREWKEEIVYWDPDKDYTDAVIAAEEAAALAAAQATNKVGSATNKLALAAPPAAPLAVAKKTLVIPKKPKGAIFPDGKKLRTLPDDQDPREVFANWLIQDDNPWFASTLVNRQWNWIMGRGIIHEVDDRRPDNPPSNPKLLDYLCDELIDHDYDMKHVLRLILTSRTYQFSSIVPASKAPDKVERNFGFYPLRRLDAEVLIDAINRVTETTDLYTSAIPEPFTFIPDNKPAIALPDGSITSPFLELFGRPARATGQDNERINKPMATQKMHLLNSGHIQRKLETSPSIKRVIRENTVKGKDTTQAILDEFYLMTLSRYPTPAEVSTIKAYIKDGVVKGNDVWIDVVWSLINSEEFLYRH